MPSVYEIFTLPHEDGMQRFFTSGEQALRAAHARANMQGCTITILRYTVKKLPHKAMLLALLEREGWYTKRTVWMRTNPRKPRTITLDDGEPPDFSEVEDDEDDQGSDLVEEELSP